MSVTNSFSEVYYGDTSVTIPFRWESQPGTPKIKFPERPLPPLTPPPSYLCTPPKKYSKSHSNSRSSGSILHTVFPKLNPWKCQLNNNLSSPVSSSSSLSWYFDSNCESPVSTLCFGSFRSSNARSRGGCSAKVIKLILGESV